MGSPKKSATLAATAAKVGSVPSDTPRSMAGDQAKSGTYSREWSVEEVVGSQPVVGRDEQQIVFAQRRHDVGQRLVKLLQRAAVALGVVAVSILRIEVHQVDKEKTSFISSR